MSMLSTLREAIVRRSFAVDAKGAALFITCYLALDWASFSYPMGPFNITPWNPPPALIIVWLLLGGFRYAPVVFLAIFAGDMLIRSAPGGLPLSVVTAFVLGIGYTSVALALRARFRFDGQLHEQRQLWIFTAVTVIGVIVVGAAYVGILWAAGFRVGGSFLGAVFRFWLGDTVGILVTAPLLMVAADADGRGKVLQSWLKPETMVQLAVLIGMLIYIFQSGDQPQRYFYLLFLPLIWIATRNGLPGAVVASGMVQVGVVVGAQIGSLQALTVIELQALVTALTLTGLVLGIIVDERERALDELKRSLRLAAASEMAGAIAHEINQPLAAMRNYGGACQILLRRERSEIPIDDLRATIDKMLHESARAADVVRRLRDLFRRGTIRLETVTVERLLTFANRIAHSCKDAELAKFEIVSDDRELSLLVDRVQIELVLRNLIANAYDAVSVLPPEKRGIVLSTHRLDGSRIRFRVTDTGPGISPQARKHLFEPLASGKVSGMGIGLAVCKTIVDAHGGLLIAGKGTHGEFDLVLPIESANE